MVSIDAVPASSKLGSRSANTMGRVLTRKPGAADWSWSEHPLARKTGFGGRSLQAMVCGGFYQRLCIGHEFAVLSDEDGLAEKLPYRISVGVRGSCLPLSAKSHHCGSCHPSMLRCKNRTRHSSSAALNGGWGDMADHLMTA